MTKTLKEYRQHIDKLDQSLLEILAQRLMLVDEIGELKRLKSLPIYDRFREEALLAARREEAKALGLPDGLIDDILCRIMQSSYLCEQKKGFSLLGPKESRIAIIGDDQGYGSLFNSLFSLSGYQVEHLSSSEASQLCNLDIILLCVAETQIASVTASLAHVSHSTLIISVNCGESELLLSTHSGNKLILYPDFSADIPYFARHTLSYKWLQHSEQHDWLLAQLKLCGFELNTLSE